jgi:hypothetical protein
MFTPLTILSVRQGPIYDERTAAALGEQLDRLAGWKGVLLAQLGHTRQQLKFAARLHRLDVGWRDAMLSYRLAMEA